jgi:TetR/AcrR family transcriptional regulator, transcriptional repressor for nem operon
VVLQFSTASEFTMSDQLHSAEKEPVRQKIIRSAGRRFSLHGFAAVSIDQIMAGAGLTRGGFYAYFNSKSELYAEAISLFIKRRRETMSAGAANGEHPAQLLQRYLASDSSIDRDTACPLVGFLTDPSLDDKKIRKSHAELLKLIVETLEGGVETGTPRRRQLALALASLCIGGFMLSRMISDRDLADELREAALMVATDLGGWEEPSPA